jgi:serine/threonine-protein kinase RsbW
MAPDLPARCSLIVKSNPSLFEGVYQQVLEKLQENHYPEDDIFAVHLAFEEGFINAIKHGNKMDPSKTVKVEYSVTPEKVELFITDEGDGFDPGQIPDPRLGDNLYRPDGRGLLLIHAYMDVIEYKDSGRCLYMARLRKRPMMDSAAG